MIHIYKSNEAKRIAKIAVICFLLFSLLMEAIILWFPSENSLKYLITIIPVIFSVQIIIWYLKELPLLNKSTRYIVKFGEMEYKFKNREDASKFYADITFDLAANLNLNYL